MGLYVTQKLKHVCILLTIEMYNVESFPAVHFDETERWINKKTHTTFGVNRENFTLCINFVISIQNLL